MNNDIYVKVVDSHNREYKLSASKLRVGDKTLAEYVTDIIALNKKLSELKLEYKEDKKSLKELSQKVEDLVTFSMEN